MRNVLRRSLAAALAIGLLLSGISCAETTHVTPTPTPAATPTPTPTPLPDTTPPPAITGLSANGIYEGRTILRWVCITSEDFDHYNVYVSKSEISDVTGMIPIHQIRDIATNTHLLTGLEKGTASYFVVTAVDKNGNENKLVATVCASVIPPLDSKATLQELPAPVKEDIEKYRKGDVTLDIVNAGGQPCSGLTVEYTQTSHDFLFGVGCTEAKTGRYPLDLYNKLASYGINFAQPWLSWGHIEPQPGQYNWQFVDDLYSPKELNGMGYVLRATNFIWFYDEYGNIPDYVRSMTFDELNQAVYKHAYDVVNHFKDSIRYWGIDEPAFPRPTGGINLTEDQYVEICKTASKAIKDADPSAKVMILVWPSDIPKELWPPPVTNKIENYHPQKFLQRLINEGVDFDVIGVEYYPLINIPCDSNDYPDLAWVSQNLDDYGKFGKPVFINETSVPDKPSQEAQAKYLESFFTMAFSKSFVHCTVWLFITDNPLIPGGGLLEDDFQPKLSFEALTGLLASWTTSGIGVTDEQGKFTFGGFGGTYQVVVTEPESGLSIQQEIKIDEQKENLSTIVFD